MHPVGRGAGRRHVPGCAGRRLVPALYPARLARTGNIVPRECNFQFEFRYLPGADPDAQAMLERYGVPMPNQNLTREDARAVLEYLRSLAGTPNQVTEE